jgi:glycosyltransferase involved in cell wall biosynthesis
MPEALAQASLVVLPSYREGLPKSLIEAAAVGRAIITTDTPGCRDTVEPGITGLLVPPRDTQALAQAMKQLLTQPQKLQSMGQRARIKAEAEFGLTQVVRAHLAVYEQLRGAAQHKP